MTIPASDAACTGAAGSSVGFDAELVAAPLIAIVAALPEEVAPLLARLSGVERRRMRSITVVHGHLGPTPVVVAVSRDGDRNARGATTELLHRMPIGRLLITGIAGALTPGLVPGALIVAADVQRVGGEPLAAPPSLVEWAARACDAQRGRVVSAAAIVDTPAQKADLAARYGAGDPAVVDLESAACVEAAREARVPWLVLRAVSDGAGEALPALLNRCRDDAGAVRRGRVVRALLRDPWTLPTLLALRRRVERCALALAAAIRSLLEAWPAAEEAAVAPRTRNMEELV
jgi:adenosylhomocysteine nucleosidase